MNTSNDERFFELLDELEEVLSDDRDESLALMGPELNTFMLWLNNQREHIRELRSMRGGGDYKKS
ncbi:MAG: hypothetical protein Q8P33_01300 [bacterium]|nr:hypothetical protein [bacterium]